MSREVVVAIDYDGTLTSGSSPDVKVLKCLKSLKEEKRFKLALVTGRFFSDVIEMRELLVICDLVVAENGCIVYFPRSGSKVKLTERDGKAVELLRTTGVAFEAGEVIISLRRWSLDKLANVLNELTDNFQVIYNVNSAMLVPKGFDKGRGLKEAFAIAGIIDPYVIAFGDGENDAALFRVADLKVAVRNAVEELRRVADVVLEKPNGEGVVEFLENKLEEVLRGLRN